MTQRRSYEILDYIVLNTTYVCIIYYTPKTKNMQYFLRITLNVKLISEDNQPGRGKTMV